MVINVPISNEIDFVSIFKEILNFEGHLNRFIGSKVTANWVNGGILPSGGVASERVCACSLRIRLVLSGCKYSKALICRQYAVTIQLCAVTIHMFAVIIEQCAVTIHLFDVTVQ